MGHSRDIILINFRHLCLLLLMYIIYGLSCRHSEGRHQCHASINNILHRAFASAKISSRLEPSGLYRSDGKRLDGMTLIPWKRGRILVWDATCWDTFAPSNLPQAIREAGAVAAKAEQIKEAKYSHLDPSHLFIPLAFETSGSLGPTTAGFIKKLAHLISRENDKPYSPSILTPEIVCCHPEGECYLRMGHVWPTGRSAPSAGSAMINSLLGLFSLLFITIIGMLYSLIVSIIFLCIDCITLYHIILLLY